MLGEEVVERSQNSMDSLRVLGRDCGGENGGGKEYAEGCVECQRDGNRLSDRVERVGIEDCSRHRDVDADTGEDCREEVRSGSESCFDIQEESRAKEYEDAENDSGCAFDKLSGLDSVEGGVVVDVGTSEVSEKTAQG